MSGPVKKPRTVTVTRPVTPKRTAPTHMPKDTSPHGNGESFNDWMPWVLGGGGALLAHSLASSIMEPSDDEKRKESVWMRLLRTLVPIGVGAAGAYGGYALGESMKSAADNKETKQVKIPVSEDIVLPSGETTIVKPEHEDVARRAVEFAKTDEFHGTSMADLFSDIAPAYKSNRETDRLINWGVAGAAGIPGVILGAKGVGKAIDSRGLTAARRNASISPQQSQYLLSQENMAGKTPLQQQHVISQVNANTQAIAKELAEKELARKQMWKNFAVAAPLLGVSGYNLWRGHKASKDIDLLHALEASATDPNWRDVLEAYRDNGVDQ